MGLYFIGGIIKHADSILAFSNPGTNSYKRLVPGFEAPIFAAYSGRNRSAFCRIPVSHPKGRRVEFRTPDPTCNPYEASAQELAQMGVKGVPSTLAESVAALEKDHEFLLADGVFTEDVIEAWADQKKSEWTGYLTRPT